MTWYLKIIYKSKTQTLYTVLATPLVLQKTMETESSPEQFVCVLMYANVYVCPVLEIKLRSLLCALVQGK